MRVPPDSSRSGSSPTVGYCKHGNEISCFIQAGKFIITYANSMF